MRHWKLALVAVLVLVVVAVYPALVGALAARSLSRRVFAQTGLTMSIERARAGLMRLTFDGLKLSDPKHQDLNSVQISVAKMVVPFSALWGSGVVQVEAPALTAKSISDVKKLRRDAKPQAQPTATKARASRAYPSVTFIRGHIQIGDANERGLRAEDVEGQLVPGEHATVSFSSLEGDVASLLGASSAGGFGAKSLKLRVALEGLRPQGVPSVWVQDGYVQALPTLGLTGITGQVIPGAANKPGGDQDITLEFHGSYGGSRERLWTAAGGFTLASAWQNSKGALALRAERFTLDKIKDVLPPTVSNPEATSVAGALNVSLASGVVSVDGTLAITNLAIFHAALASAPVQGLSASVAIDGSFDTRSGVLEVKHIEGHLKDLAAKLSGRLQLAEGSYTFEDGRTWPWLPKIELTLEVPKLPCQQVLASFPQALIPKLQGFSLKGVFEANLQTKIDYADLESLVLDGKVGIDGCKVVAAPAAVADLADGDVPLTQIVQVPPNWDERGTEPQELLFVVGADSADFVPINEVSPHLINSFLTTEDSAFFKHRGFATREFRTALKRNLERGRFRQGASSITMQMVKNLLLSHEKTLSRKLQELFLVWYLEQILSKERILELYLNAIEFGPRIYGIGPAARHYFGKSASDLNPVEAAFFSSILPSPKRRYVHYCHGAVSTSGDKHIKRILSRMRERDRLTDEELTLALATPLAFDLTERGASERQCLEWITRITATPRAEPEVLEDVE